MPGDMDCHCSIWGRSFSTVPDDTEPNSDPTVTLSFGMGYHNGTCDGMGLNCPQVTACGGKVNLHVVPKPFTSFTNHPGGVWGVNMFGTFDYTETLSNCGQTRDREIDVWSSVGTNLGVVTLWIFCTWCSDSTGDA